MAKAHRLDMQNYARLGALARLEEIRTELADIARAFPGLASDRSPARAQTRNNAAARPRGQRSMTAAQRKAVSLRMKRYWAARRKASAS